MCEVCGSRHGVYATHTRRRDEGADEAVAEALRTARALGRAAAGLPPRPAQRHRLGAPLHRARRATAAAAGMDVAFDMHTRLYGTTFLLTALPPWALEDPARLRGDPRQRRAAAEAARATRASSARAATGAGSSCSTTTPGPDYARRDIASIAAERGQDPLDAVYDLLLGAAAATRAA